LPPGPEIPDWVDLRDLDPAVRSALRGLDPRAVDRVAGHLVAAGTLVDDDPAAALAHARAARDRATRVAAVREAVGVAAYAAGDYAEAARELRAYRRMSGDEGYRAVLADCERALGRPEVALRLVTEALAASPGPEEASELRLVEAGARRDLGERPAARLVLEAALTGGAPGARLDPSTLDSADVGRLRLASAYADLLADEGEHARSIEWLTAVAAADPEDAVGALGRLGIEFTDMEDDAAEDDESARAAEDPVADEGSEAVEPRGSTEAVGLEDDDAGQHDAEDDDAEDDDEVPDQSTYLPDPAGFDAEVAAEVAELLGESGPPAGSPDGATSTPD
jgi:tetratricopeptide (TPR) repeat protein